MARGCGPCYDFRMGATLRKPMTLAAFLAWEDRQEQRWEYDGVGRTSIPLRAIYADVALPTEDELDPG